MLIKLQAIHPNVTVLASALWNELYYLSDGGSFWISTSPSPPTSDIDTLVSRSLLLLYEGHEYYMLNTYDVYYYASFALSVNWPLLDRSCHEWFGRGVWEEDGEERIVLGSGKNW